MEDVGKPGEKTTVTDDDDSSSQVRVLQTLADLRPYPCRLA